MDILLYLFINFMVISKNLMDLTGIASLNEPQIFRFGSADHIITRPVKSLPEYPLPLVF